MPHRARTGASAETSKIMAITRDNSENLLCLQYVAMFFTIWLRSQISTPIKIFGLFMPAVRFSRYTTHMWVLYIPTYTICNDVHLSAKVGSTWWWRAAARQRWNVYRKMQNISLFECVLSVVHISRPEMHFKCCTQNQTVACERIEQRKMHVVRAAAMARNCHYVWMWNIYWHDLWIRLAEENPDWINILQEKSVTPGR